MRIIKIRVRSSPRTSRRLSSPSTNLSFGSSDFDIDSRRPQTFECHSNSSSSSWIGCPRSSPRQTYWDWGSGRASMNRPHKNWLYSWFRRETLPRRERNLPRAQTSRAFVVDPPYTKASHHRQSPFASRARPASSRMDPTFIESRGRSRSRSRRDREVHELREVRNVRTETPRIANRRSIPAPRNRLVSPRNSFADLRGRSHSRSRPQYPREIHEVRENRPEPEIKRTPTRHFRLPRERTPVVERAPLRAGRWISPNRRSSLPDEEISPPLIPRFTTRGLETRRTRAGEERRTTTRVPSPIANYNGRSEGRPDRTVNRSPQTQPHRGVVIEERHHCIERPQIINSGRREMSGSKRFTYGEHGHTRRVRFKTLPSRFLEPKLFRGFRDHRNRQERFIDERGPLDRWRKK